jgi:predicted phosphodiesterase
MKIAIYSDLHLEFGQEWKLPGNLDADILILAGDIIVFDDFNPLKVLLESWDKPVIFVAGNHENYTEFQRPMEKQIQEFKNWLPPELPQVHFLQNEGFSLNGVHFFGGTMWTDLLRNFCVLPYAPDFMNDYRKIYRDDEWGPYRLSPNETLQFHDEFKCALQAWFEEKLEGPRVVITHHAPVESLRAKTAKSFVLKAYVCYDMLELMEKYQPSLWIHGHTHVCETQTIGQTKFISNALGYPYENGGYECSNEFDEHGQVQEL